MTMNKTNMSIKMNIRIRSPSTTTTTTASSSSSPSTGTTTTTTTTTSTQPPPDLQFMTSSPCLVTHSTLPLWRTKRNSQSLKKKKKSVLGSDEDKVRRVKGIDTAIITPKTTTADGTAAEEEEEEDKAGRGSWAWHWRGTGRLLLLLKAASSRWEVLGHGTIAIPVPAGVPAADRDEDEDGDGDRGDGPGPAIHADAVDEEEKIDWMVTYFSKTLFTPAGVDIYMRPGPRSRAAASSLSEALLEGVKRGLKETGDAVLARLADELFPVQHDSA
ncbi:hypothetical protein M432DRAFT_657600 [Thermoascus aurantiacus ATCC 26904]